VILFQFLCTICSSGISAWLSFCLLFVLCLFYKSFKFLVIAYILPTITNSLNSFYFSSDTVMFSSPSTFGLFWTVSLVAVILWPVLFSSIHGTFVGFRNSAYLFDPLWIRIIYFSWSKFTITQQEKHRLKVNQTQIQNQNLPLIKCELSHCVFTWPPF
jgi:hypothetical protein